MARRRRRGATTVKLVGPLQPGQRRIRVDANTGQPRRRRRARRRNRTAGNQPRLSRNMAGTYELACSMYDPWSCAASIPDGRVGTGKFSIRQEVQLSTGATGTCCGVALNPLPGSLLWVDSANGTSPTIPGGATNWSQASALSVITGQYARARPISLGMKAMYIGPTVSDGGAILVGTNPGLPLSNFNGMALATFASSLKDYKVIPMRNGCSITWRPADMSDMTDFVPITGSVPLLTAFNIPNLIIWAYGAAMNQACLQVEIVANFEGEYGNQSFIPGGLDQNQTPAEPGWKENMLNMLPNVSSIQEFTGSVADLIRPQATRVVANAIGSMANGLLAPGVLGRGRRTQRIEL